MKKYLYYCPVCKKVTLMTLVKEDKNTNTIFLNCLVCSESDPKSKTKSVIEKEKKENVKVYSPKENYKVGDVLYHKAFNDTGEVIKITKRFNGQTINTVLFKSAGMKKLITIERKKA